MIRSYLPALVFVGLGAFLGVVFAFINTLVGPRKPKRVAKTDPYESGLPSDVKQEGFRFGISFYLIAMLFILFDIEVVLIYPVALGIQEFGTAALVKIIIFVALLAVAFAHQWRRGALDWK